MRRLDLLFNRATRWACRLTPAAAAVAAALLWAEGAFAQDAHWPLYPLDGHRFPDNEYGRGPGGYLSLFSLVVYWLMFLGWIKAVDWVNRDTMQTRMSTALWNPIVFFPFFFGFFLFALSVPYVGWLLTLLALLGPLGAYIFIRNKKVEPQERVLTPDHLRHVFSSKARSVGVKVEAEKKLDYQKGAPVELTAMGAESDQANQANAIKSRQSPGYLDVKEVVAAALDLRADRIMLDYTQQGVAVKHQVDGVWHDAQPRDRESGDTMLAVMKTLANLNPNERRARQNGKFGAEYQGRKYTCRISAQGVQTGERVVVQFEGTEVPIESLEAAGMRPKMLEQLKESLSGSTGMAVLSAMPGGGMTTLLTLTMKSLDRYMRDFYIVEDKDSPEPEVENVQPVTYDAAGGQKPSDVFRELFHKAPDVIVVPNLSDPDTAAGLCEQAVEESLVICTLRAKEAAEALLRVLALKTPPNQFAPVAKLALNVRLVRKLCEECRQPYAPNPEMLKKLGVPPDRVQAFYRPPPPPEDPKDICRACRGIGYKGRIGVFELLTVNDKLREALVKQPKLEVLRKVARASGHRGLQEEGLVLVVKGVTSLQELQRVLKQ